jgi:hypothetical protein
MNLPIDEFAGVGEGELLGEPELSGELPCRFDFRTLEITSDAVGGGGGIYCVK